METSDKLPIVDAHQHFWDLSRNYHPWLLRPGADPVPLRRLFARSSAATCRRTTAATAPASTSSRPSMSRPSGIRATPLAETRWVEAIAAEHGLPSAVVAQAWLDRADAAEVLAGQARAAARARHPAQAGGGGAAAGRPPRRRRLDGRSAMAARLRAPRAARAVVRPADAVVASRCRSGARRATSRRRRSSSTTPACRPTAAPEGLAGWRRGA